MAERERDALHIHFVGPADPEYGPPTLRVLAPSIDALAEAWGNCKHRKEMLRVVPYYYRRPRDDGPHVVADEPMYVNPDHIESIGYASKDHREAARMRAEGDRG